MTDVQWRRCAPGELWQGLLRALRDYCHLRRWSDGRGNVRAWGSLAVRLACPHGPTVLDDDPIGHEVVRRLDVDVVHIMDASILNGHNGVIMFGFLGGSHFLRPCLSF